jgi:hypothetical protein
MCGSGIMHMEGVLLAAYVGCQIEEKVVHIAQRNQKRGVKEKSVNREKHEKDKMTEDSNTHGSEES